MKSTFSKAQIRNSLADMSSLKTSFQIMFGCARKWNLAKLLVEHKFDVGYPHLVAYLSSTGVRPEITPFESMPCKKDQLGLLANRCGKIVSFETAFG